MPRHVGVSHNAVSFLFTSKCPFGVYASMCTTDTGPRPPKSVLGGWWDSSGMCWIVAPGWA